MPHADQVVGLPTGQHITLKFKTPEGEEVLRPYTPVTDDDTPGHVDFVIKVPSPLSQWQCMVDPSPMMH